MNKIKNILIGWKNLLLDIISDIKYKDIFNERLNICKSCKYYKIGICQKCGCVVAAKTKAEDEECPIKKWSIIK